MQNIKINTIFVVIQPVLFWEAKVYVDFINILIGKEVIFNRPPTQVKTFQSNRNEEGMHNKALNNNR